MLSPDLAHARGRASVDLLRPEHERFGGQTPAAALAWYLSWMMRDQLGPPSAARTTGGRTLLPAEQIIQTVVAVLGAVMRCSHWCLRLADLSTTIVAP